MDIVIFGIAFGMFGCLFGAFGSAFGQKKGRGIEGFWWGFLGGPIGLLIVISFLEDHSGLRCPYCQSWITSTAVKCPRCGSVLEDETPARPTIPPIRRRVS